MPFFPIPFLLSSPSRQFLARNGIINIPYRSTGTYSYTSCIPHRVAPNRREYNFLSSGKVFATFSNQDERFFFLGGGGRGRRKKRKVALAEGARPGERNRSGEEMEILASRSGKRRRRRRRRRRLDKISNFQRGRRPLLLSTFFSLRFITPGEKKSLSISRKPRPEVLNLVPRTPRWVSKPFRVGRGPRERLRITGQDERDEQAGFQSGIFFCALLLPSLLAGCSSNKPEDF